MEDELAPIQFSGWAQVNQYLGNWRLSGELTPLERACRRLGLGPSVLRLWAQVPEIAELVLEGPKRKELPGRLCGQVEQRAED